MSAQLWHSVQKALIEAAAALRRRLRSTARVSCQRKRVLGWHLVDPSKTELAEFCSCIRLSD